MLSPKRVVITGMGVISPVGLDVPTAWRNLTAGNSGVRPITFFDAREFGVRFAGEPPGFDPLDYLPARMARRTDRFSHYALAALEEALAQSRIKLEKYDPYEIGVIVGAGVGGIRTYTQELNVLQEKGPRRVSPFLIPTITIDAAAVQIALRTGAQGPNFGVASACATGADALGQAYVTIQRGEACAMFTGGVEAAVTPIGVAAFDRMQALSHRNEQPQAASRPFDAGRDGFVMADGGGILLLEELEFALRRGAEPLAEILAYACTSDAIHLAAPDAEGAGAARCMARALAYAGVRPEQVSYINAHGTSTPAGDPAETQAIKAVFGPAAYHTPVSSTKSMTGHMLGGAGAMEAIVCVQALNSGLIPPTINQETPDPACDLDYVPNRARRAELEIVLSNSFGFGGHNVALVFKRWRG